MTDRHAHEYVPVDLLIGYIEIDGPIRPGKDIGTDPTDFDYDPTGTTRVDWNGQRTIGHGCSICGLTILADRIDVDGQAYVKESAGSVGR